MRNSLLNLQRHLTKGISLTPLTVLLFLTLCHAGDSGRILVDIEEIKADQGGTLIVALFDSKGSWPKHDSALSRQLVDVSDTAMQVGFDQITPDRSYAVQVFHDKNRNDKLDFRWFPYPKPSEGVGVSNNNRRIGPPSFEKALFPANGPETNIHIKLDY